MGMTVDNHIRIVQAFGHKFLVMDHEEATVFYLKCQRLRHTLSSFHVVVSADYIQGSNALQLFDNLRLVDIAGMDDAIAAVDAVDDLRLEKIVSVGDNGYGFGHGVHLRIFYDLSFHMILVLHVLVEKHKGALYFLYLPA